jgi:hypothetical protein
MSVIDDTRKVLQDFLAPELRELKGSILALNARLDALGSKLQTARDENARGFEEVNSKLNLLLNLHSIEQRLAKLAQRSA